LRYRLICKDLGKPGDKEVTISKPMCLLNRIIFYLRECRSENIREIEARI
jgi:hypothetical protein